MSRELLLLLLVLVITSWSKAGLANFWNLWAVDLAVLFCLMVFLMKFRKKRRVLCLNLIPILCLCICCTISFLNPSYKVLSQQEWRNLNIDDYFSNERNIKKVNMLNNTFQDILKVQENDPDLGIALFFDLKNRYLDRFGSKESPCTQFLNLYEKEINLNPVEYIPSSPISSKNTLFSCVHFIFIITFGIIMYFSIQTRNDARICALVIAINAGLLALVGIIQKFNYVPNDNLKEIFGIWDTPEPRYFYSSFTYKNHWACFAITSLFSSIAVLHQRIKHSAENLMHDKKLFLLVGIILCIIISIPHSGSRSGTIILILGILLSGSITFINFVHTKTQSWSTFALVFIVIISVFTFSFSLNRETSNEMRINTLSQIENMSNNEKPLRFLLWQDLLVQIESNTMWGYGYHSYRALNPTFQSSQVRKLRSTGLHYAHHKYTPLVGHGHSDLLEYISEFGICIVLILLTYPLIAVSTILRNPSTFPKIGLLGCIAYFCFSLVDFPSRTPACLLLFVSTLALCWKYASLSTAPSSSKI